MSKPKVEDMISEIVTEIIQSTELELVDVEYVKEGGAWFLRVYIDKPAGITHEDCQKVSVRLSEVLDERDPIPGSYILEVSSPGIERPLKKPEDFIKFRGHKVRATTFSPVDGQKEFVGELESRTDESIVINLKDKQIALPVKQVARIRLEADI